VRTRLITALLVAALGGFSPVIPLAAPGKKSPSPSPAASAAASPAAASPSPSPDPVAVQLQKAAAEKLRLDAIKASLAGAVEGAKDQQKNLDGMISANRKAIDDTLAKLAEAGRRLQEAGARAASEHATALAAHDRAVQDQRVLSRYVRMRYLQQDDDVFYAFSSESLSDLFSRTASISQAGRRGEQLLAQVRRDREEAQTAEASAHHDASLARAASAQLIEQKHQLEIQTATARDLSAHLSVQEQQATAAIARTTVENAALAQHIADLRIQQLDETIAAAQEAAWKAATYYLANHLGTLPPGLTPGAGGVVGGLLWAAPGAPMSQPFGPSPYPFEPGYLGFAHFHTGLDMAGPMDTRILAAADGVVASASEGTTGYGNHLIIGHSSTMLTLYGHLATMLVHTGDTVRRGQLIGLMGSTGNSTGPHLHFEVRVNNVPTDPAPLLAPVLPEASDATKPVHPSR